MATISTTVIPTSFHEANKHLQWHEAVAAKIEALETNHTWCLNPLPPGKHVIGCKQENGRMLTQRLSH
jgi:hypothetical protein